MEDLQKKKYMIKGKGGGGDGTEDLVRRYELALDEMNGKNCIKIIIHIADSDGHGTEFSKGMYILIKDLNYFLLLKNIWKQLIKW